jgi:hypothetical protein
LESVQTDPFLLWHRFPLEYMTAVDSRLNDTFVAALLTSAMALGEGLRIEGVVSGRLMESLPRLQAIYQDWNEGLSIISVESSGLDYSAAPEGCASRVGLFFSLGIDSFYSLLKDHRDHPGDGTVIDHLVFVRGFDIAVDDPRVDGLFTTSIRNAEKVADQFGKSLVVAATNLRQRCGAGQYRACARRRIEGGQDCLHLRLGTSLSLGFASPTRSVVVHRQGCVDPRRLRGDPPGQDPPGLSASDCPGDAPGLLRES